MNPSSRTISTEEIELKMQGTQMPPPRRESTNPNPRKKMKLVQDQTLVQDNENHRGHNVGPHPVAPTNPRKKSSKRILHREPSPSLPLHLDAKPAPVPTDDYKELRRRYKSMDKEGLTLDRELNIVNVEIQCLEREKDSLLDKLVVLEGIVDPSEMY